MSRNALSIVFFNFATTMTHATGAQKTLAAVLVMMENKLLKTMSRVVEGLFNKHFLISVLGLKPHFNTHFPRNKSHCTQYCLCLNRYALGCTVKAGFSF